MGKLRKIHKKVMDYIQYHNMIEQGDQIVIGVSGGADSMCLLSILMELKSYYNLNLIVVHVHHGIRGKEADEDMEYVERFCNENEISYRFFKYDIPKMSKEERLSSEELGRIKRYEAFKSVIHDIGNSGKIAVAHNKDDSSETFLLNLFRGTGIKGITGIPAVRENIIRPILCLSRDEIIFYLKEKNVSYRTDSTNNETEYTRNKIRLDFMPYITKNINEKAKEHINSTAKMLGEINEYLEKQAQEAYNKYVGYDNVSDEYYIDNKLWTKDIVIIKMVVRKTIQNKAGKLKDITLTHINDVIKLGENCVSKSIDIPYGIVVTKSYSNVVLKTASKNNQISSMEEININLYDIITNGEIVYTHAGGFKFSFEQDKSIDLTEKTYTKWMNYDILKDSLSIRNRKAGDYMVINKEGQKKKIKDLFIDLKIPKYKRDSILLLSKGSEIFWILGYRISENCKITHNTKNIVKIEYLTKDRNGAKDV